MASKAQYIIVSLALALTTSLFSADWQRSQRELVERQRAYSAQMQRQMDAQRQAEAARRAAELQRAREEQVRREADPSPTKTNSLITIQYFIINYFNKRAGFKINLKKQYITASLALALATSLFGAESNSTEYQPRGRTYAQHKRGEWVTQQQKEAIERDLLNRQQLIENAKRLQEEKLLMTMGKRTHR